MEKDAITSLFIIFLVIAAFGGDSHRVTEPIANKIDCYTIEGEVVQKDIEDGQHKLWIRLTGSSPIVNGGEEGHILWVQEGTYESYEVGDTYNSYTCEWETLMWWLEVKDSLIDGGMLQPITG